MTKKLFFCFTSLLLTVFSHAQFNVSVVGGIHNSSVTPNFLSYPDTTINTEIATTGVEIGFYADVPITNKFFFRPGVIYFVKGSNWNQIYDTANLVANTKHPQKNKLKPRSLTTKLNVSYINMPLNVVYKTNIGAKTKFVIGAGPQVSFFFNGYKETNLISVSQDSAAKVKLHFSINKNTDLPVGKLTEKYRTLHFGANALAGFEFGRMYLMVTYNQDLTEFYEEGGREYKNKSLGAALGIYFGQPPKKTSSPKKK